MESKSQIPRIFFWVLPRTCSTVFTKLISFVDGAQIWLEPYDCCFQTKFMLDADSHTPEMEGWCRSMFEATRLVSEGKSPYSGKMHPIRTSVSYSWVKSELEKEEPGKNFIFIKDHASAVVSHLDALPDNVPCRHVFLIRHPAKALSGLRRYALRRSTADPDKFDLRTTPMYSKVWDQHYEFWKYVKEHLDPDALIVDTDDILNKPLEVLPKLFQQLNIPWKDSYLKWPKSDDIVREWKGVEDHFLRGMLTKVFDQAIASECLLPSKPLENLEDMSKDIQELSKQYMPAYEEMYAQSI
ncbi:hypothetical protein HOLleu_42666 [Holothuria leucospilota]|uniref:Sulfotransferase n=1 Tax=Holothuria leucospilota TaxID=206669 RepID=A0A9Q0YHY2_HOLLE|nr:hypothetical protein HOLleu_42666 [Holothuria leucospilota]